MRIICLFALLFLFCCSWTDTRNGMVVGSDTGSLSRSLNKKFHRGLKLPKQYPSYDADADNPYYVPDAPKLYPRYDPEADNPYYPPYIYIPPEKIREFEYQYPTYEPEADNPFYPPRKPKERQFDRPLFDE